MALITTSLLYVFGIHSEKLFPNAKVEQCKNGELCIKKVLNDPSKETIDLIVIDQYMDASGGSMLGSDCTRMLRKNGFKSIILGTSGNNDCKADFMKADANGFIEKPMVPLEKISNLLVTLGF